MIGGPALGGFIYALGAAVAYGACLALLVVSTAFVASIRRIPPVAGGGAGVAGHRCSRASRFIWRKKPVLGAISLDLFAVLLGGATALLPIYAKDILDTGPWGLGLLRARAGGRGAGRGPRAGARPLARHVGRRMFVSVAIYGVAIVVFGLSRDFTLSLRRARGERRRRHGERRRSGRRSCSSTRPTTCAAA